MGFVGLLKVSLTFLLLLAWPFFALGYPFWASIQAIETKSESETQNLITYWISFSVILLFEHAFEKLLQWLSFWCYIKLGIVICLVTNDFAGSLYVYKNLVRPCLSVDLQTFICWFNEVKQSFYKKDKFRVQLENYVKDNGIEALENIIAARGAIPSLGMKEIKAITEVKQTEFDEPKVAVKGIAPVEFAEKEEVTQTKQFERVEFKPPLANSTFSSPDTKETTSVPKAGGGLPHIPLPRNVQKEWTCSLCLVTATSEGDLNSHLGGRRHKAARKKLKAKSQTPETKVTPASGATKSNVPIEEPKKPTPNKGTAPKCKKPVVQKQPTGESMKNDVVVAKNSRWRCTICDVKCYSQETKESHLNGRKHWAKVNEQNGVTKGTEGVCSCFTC